MSEQTVAQTVRIANPEGLHMRPAGVFAKLAGGFSAQIEVSKNDERVDGKSITDLMTLAAAQYDEITIRASGCDAPAALAALVELCRRNFAAEADDESPPSPQPSEPS